MERVDINAKVEAIIALLMKISKEMIKQDSTLESLGADSLNRVQLIMELEETFSIEINDEDAEKFSTVSQIVDYLEQRIKQKQ